ncbi:hypothetical protein LZC95_08420 [Pendulispora brunnea]|uniref:Uncharacterized protein n=1 Tax=Pendulispora brunnea TaxID=2905690 RepID=A0ABZ2KIH2_9BACT
MVKPNSRGPKSAQHAEQRLPTKGKLSPDEPKERAAQRPLAGEAGAKSAGPLTGERRVREYIRSVMREAATNRGGPAMLARVTGLSKSNISYILRDPPLRDPSLNVMQVIATKWLGLPYDQMRAEVLAGKRGVPMMEEDDDGITGAESANLATAMELRPFWTDTVKKQLLVIPIPYGDPTVDWWVERGDNLLQSENVSERGRRNPPAPHRGSSGQGST